MTKKISFKQFIIKYLVGSNQLGGDYKGIEWRSYMKFKELTSLLDYNCQFENGLCAHERKKLLRDKLSEVTPQCCCGGCASNIGYLSYIPDINTARQIYELYDMKNGFWSDKGCTLPRGLRSNICLTHFCQPRKKFQSECDLYEIISEGLLAIDNYYFGRLNYRDDEIGTFATYTRLDKPGEIFEIKCLKNPRGSHGSYQKIEDVYKHLTLRIRAGHTNHMKHKKK
jgi:hypothetical protein